MVSVTLFLVIWFGANSDRESIQRAYTMPDIATCSEKATEIGKRKPPDGGVIFVGCEIVDLGPTQ